MQDLLKQRAVSMAEEHGFVMVPTREKHPMNQWRRQKKSYGVKGKFWDMCTGFGIITGELSGITVVDIDTPAMEYFNTNILPNLKKTTIVETPSGGLHLYYNYNQELKTTTKLSGLDIDIRNDGAIIMAPGSPYEAKGEKSKYNGIEYKFRYDFDQFSNCGENLRLR